MKKLICILCTIFVKNAYGFTNIDNVSIEGYIGYKYLWSSIDQELMSLNSKPELGLIWSWEPDDNWGV